MKKLLVLMLVLGLASMAQADLVIKLYKSGGAAFDPLTEMLNVSDTLEIRIESINGNTGDSNPCLYTDETYGLIAKSGSVTHIPPAPDASGINPGSAKDNLVTGLGTTEDGICGTVAAFVATPPYANGEYFTDITFTCVAIGDAVLNLVDIYANWDVLPANGGVPMDKVTIHQIPEPATMLLLGLGGLFLRRRK